MEKPLISIILTTYNRCRLLPRAIDSVVGGSYDNFELIVVDDASSDGTEELASKLRDPRIRYLRQPENGGVLRARNRGFDAARGGLVTILDDDDELVADALAVVVREFERAANTDTDVLWFNCMDAESGNISGFIPVADAPIEFADYLSGRVHGDFWMVFRRDAIAEYRFDERLRAHESLLWLRIHRKHRARHCSKVLCKKYREHGEPRLCDIDVRMDQLEHTTLALAQFVHEFGPDLARTSPSGYGGRLAYLGLHQLATSDFASGRASIRRSLSYRFSVKYLMLYLISYFMSANVAVSLIRRSQS
jgi:glycosyltransferase involved in cell wall biosynthesis